MNKNVLIVEDYDYIRTAIAEYLEDNGYIPFCIENGHKALKFIESKGISFFNSFIIDYKMPYMNGLELAKHIRKLNNDATIICISAQFEDENNQLTDFDYYIKKPFKNQFLVDCIENEIRKKSYNY